MAPINPTYSANPAYLGITMAARGKLGSSKKVMKPVFTDNSKVYYKPGSLAAGGIGTVRNSGVKSRKI
jgi:hypothetical protein